MKNAPVTDNVVPLEIENSMGKSAILIVDDEPMILDLLGECFSEKFTVVCVGESNLVEPALKNSNFDFILSDIKMPNYEIKDLVKYRDVNCPDTPITLMTGHAQSTEEKKVYRELGVLEILDKPFDDVNVVVSLIEGMLLEHKSKKAG